MVPAGGIDKPVRMQFAIEARRGGELGRSWAEFWRLEGGAVARSTTVLSGGPIHRPICVETNLNYDRQDRLDQLRIWVYGLPVSPVQVEAES